MSDIQITQLRSRSLQVGYHKLVSCYVLAT